MSFTDGMRSKVKLGYFIDHYIWLKVEHGFFWLKFGVGGPHLAYSLVGRVTLVMYKSCFPFISTSRHN